MHRLEPRGIDGCPSGVGLAARAGALCTKGGTTDFINHVEEIGGGMVVVESKG